MTTTQARDGAGRLGVDATQHYYQFLLVGPFDPGVLATQLICQPLLCVKQTNKTEEKMGHTAVLMASMLERQLHDLMESLDAMAARRMADEIKQLRLLAALEGVR